MNTRPCALGIAQVGFAERGLSFEPVAELDWDTLLIVEDTRDKVEPRLRVMRVSRSACTRRS